jgi:hypothetical protein
VNERNYGIRPLELSQTRPANGFWWLLALLCLSATPRECQSAVVTEATEASLRAATASGGTVQFACDGTITVANPITVTLPTVLDGTGHQITISGGGMSRVFQISTNIAFTLANLTIANGLSTNGGGVYNAGGTLYATNCAFTANFAFAADGTNSLDPNGKPGRGGAVYNAGAAQVSRCTFSQNSAHGGAGFAPSDGSQAGAGGPAEGGAIYNAGSLSGSQCTFSQNIANGGAGGVSYNGIWNFAFSGAGGPAAAGAIYNAGTLWIEASLFAGNTGNGGPGANGRNSPRDGFGGTINGCMGGAGGAACGTLFINGPAVLVNCTLANNQAQGGTGGNGGIGGWYINMGTGQYTYGNGGLGGGGGDAQAAFYDAAGGLRLTNCTVAYNTAAEGSGGSTGMNGNGGYPGPPGSPGFAGGALVTMNGILVNTLLATNTPRNGSGFIVDAGHNLSSDSSCSFGHSGSLNGTDPNLGPLGNNGGPTLTLMPAPGSPAIDAGDPASSPPLDQRGYPRTFGSAPDIGAAEYWPPGPFLLISRSSPDSILIQVAAGIPGQTCRLHASGNLANWSPTATNQVGSNGMAVFSDSLEHQRFYRAEVY